MSLGIKFFLTIVENENFEPKNSLSQKNKNKKLYYQKQGIQHFLLLDITVYIIFLNGDA